MRLLTFILIIFLVNACTSIHYSTEQRVAIAENVYFDLIPIVPFIQQNPSAGSIADNKTSHYLRFTQSATVTYTKSPHANNPNNDQRLNSHDLIFQTEIINNTLTMVGLTPTGTRLFTIIMNNGTIQANGLSSMIDTIKPEYLLADLQLSLWPEHTLQQAIQGARLQQNSDFKRVVMRDGEAIITIRYTKQPAYTGQINFIHHQRGYQLQIAPIDVEEGIYEQ